MTDSKVFTLLRSLSDSEFKDLEKFSQSPFFTAGRNFEKFFMVLKPFYPAFNEKKLTREYLFNKLYPGQKYDVTSASNKIKILFSRFYKLCMSFLIQLDLKKDASRRNYYLLNQLRMKGINNDFEKKYDEAMKDNDLMKGSAFDFLDKFYIEGVNKIFHMRKDDYKKTFECALTMNEYCVVAALIKCFKHESDKIVMKGYKMNIRNSVMDDLLLSLDAQALLDKLKKNNDRFYPYLKIGYVIYKMQMDPDNLGTYLQLKKMMSEHSGLYGTLEKFAISVTMESFCMKKKRNVKDNQYLVELFELYNNMLAGKYYKVSPGENFNVVLFRNMVNIAYRLGHYDWIKDLVKNYSDELAFKHRKDMRIYCLAVAGFGHRELETALGLVMIIEYELYLYKIDVKMMLLKIHYELRNFEQLYSAIDSTMHYLRTAKNFTDRHIKSGKLFISHLKEILKLRLNEARDRTEVKFLKDKIQTDEDTSDIEWLLEKVDELKSL